MKRLIYIISALLFLSSCVKELREPLITVDGKEVPAGYALVDFSVKVPSKGPETKAFADTPQIQNLYLAVFDQNSYLEDFVEATSKGPVSSSVDNTYPNVNYDESSSSIWNFQATLPISTDPRYIHFIANSPVTKLSFGREDEIIGDLATEGTTDAYWQRVELPSGITVDKQGVLSESVQTKLQNIALVRNFSKISVTASPVTDDDKTSNFSLKYIYIMNRPTSGTVAPYSASSSNFVVNYQNYTSDELKGTSTATPSAQTAGSPIVGNVYEGVSSYSSGLEQCILAGSDPVQYVYLSRTKASGNAEAGKTYYTKTQGTALYEGWMPASYDIDNKNPGEASDNNSNWIKPATNANGENYASDFLYERIKPSSATDNPVCVLVYGTYYGDKTNHPQGIDCYYKVDIKDGDDNYFAVLRNFDYKINIRKINAIGRLNIEDAMTMPGSGNVSTDVSNGDKTNISDGISRIAVSFTDTTVVTGNAFKLKYKFIPDFQNNPNTEDNTIVDISANETGKRVTATTEGTMFTFSIDNSSTDAEGYNTIIIDPEEPGATAREQKLVITGIAVDGSTIKREITVVLREKMDLKLYCDPATIEKQTGTEFDVVLQIPNELNRMLFPLEVKIEAQNLSITPAQGDNLPVESGVSINPDQGDNTKTAFYFIKTISWADYTAAALSEEGTRDIRCHFKSNTANSATRIWAANEYFNTGYTDLGNFDAYKFTNLKYATGSNFTPGQDVTFTFDFESQDGFNSLTSAGKPVTVTLVNLRPQDGDNTLEGGTPSAKIEGGYEYTFTPTAKTGNTLHITTTAAKGPYVVYLDAYHFSQAYKGRTRKVSISASALTFKNDTNYDVFGTNYRSAVSGNVIIREDEYPDDITSAPRTAVTSTPGRNNQNYTFKNTDAVELEVDVDATAVYFLYDLNGTIYSASKTFSAGESDIYLSGTVTFSKRKTQGQLVISDLSLYVGENQAVSITKNTNSGSTITYEVSDPSIATITNGVVTGLKAGTVTVTASVAATSTYSSATTSFKVTVNKHAVQVSVTDTVNGDVKSGLTIKNTGASKVYIRAIVCANWYDESGNIVAPWSAAPGTFVGLPGTGWIEDGGIYYYTPALDPTASPTALFTKYTKAAAPVPGATLKMTIYVQALEYEEGKTCQQVFQNP